MTAFRWWLVAGGWTPVTPSDHWTDIEAVRGEERLICEAKGRTSAKGVDADIAVFVVCCASTCTR
ncbi:hypothetical protein ACWGDE_27380 [Streptomyces sp. NPDC054956]